MFLANKNPVLVHLFSNRCFVLLHSLQQLLYQISISWLQNYRAPSSSTYLTLFRNYTKNVVVETIIAAKIAYLHLHLLGQHTQRAITAAVIVPVVVIKATMMGIPVFTNVICPPAPVGSLAVAVHVGEQ